MIKKPSFRYYCEHCGKSGGSAGAMKTHEKHCTLNPSRECRICKHIDKKPKDNFHLLRIMANTRPSKSGELDWVKEMIDFAGGCPMCVFSALRQSGHLRWDGTTEPVKFDLEKEMASFWAEVNNAEAERDVHASLYG